MDSLHSFNNRRTTSLRHGHSHNVKRYGKIACVSRGGSRDDVEDSPSPTAIFNNVFDEYHFSITLNLFDSNNPHSLSTHNRKYANKINHIR